MHQGVDLGEKLLILLKSQTERKKNLKINISIFRRKRNPTFYVKNLCVLFLIIKQYIHQAEYYYYCKHFLTFWAVTLLINISFKKEEEKKLQEEPERRKKVFKKPTKCLSTSIDKSKMPFIGIKCPDYKLKSRARETVLKLSSLTWWILQEPLEDHPLVSISYG